MADPDLSHQADGPELTPGPTWSDIAPWYDRLLQDGSGPHQTALDCLLGLTPLADARRVLDLGCGQGLVSRALLEQGVPEVTGVDASAAMIALAEDHGPPPTGIGELSYVVDDGQTLGRFEDNGFDGVTSQLALMDIPDLSATLAAVNRVLKPGGWFSFVISHPCFLAPRARPVDTGGIAEVSDDEPGPAVVVHTYLSEQFWRSGDPQGVRRAGVYHRTMSTYLNELIAAGFVMEQTEEPRANRLLAERSPVYHEVPIFFAARCRKGPGSATA